MQHYSIVSCYSNVSRLDDANISNKERNLNLLFPGILDHLPLVKMYHLKNYVK